MKKFALNTNTSFLKVIAVISMIIDHIGAIMFPDVILFRIIGRIAFPLFAYCVYIGYFKTSNLKKYILRLLIFGTISQPIYSLVLGANIFSLNIYFSLIFELLLIYCLDKKKYYYFLVLSFIFILLNPEYSYHVVFFVPILYYFNNDRVLFSAAYLVMNMILLLVSGPLQFLSILSLVFVLIRTNINVRASKWIYYSIYPVHLLVIYFINYFLIN